MEQNVYIIWYIIKDYNETYYEIIASFKLKRHALSVLEKLDDRFKLCKYLDSRPFAEDRKNMLQGNWYLIERKRVCVEGKEC